MKKYANVDEFGTGVVENPIQPFGPNNLCGIDDYDKFDKQHPPLKVYTKNNELVRNCRVEVEGPVWRMWLNKDEKWVKISNPDDYYGAKVEQIYLAVEAGKEQVNDDKGNYKGEAYYKQYTGEILELFYHRFYDGLYSGDATKEQKQDAFYEWLNDQIKNTIY